MYVYVYIYIYIYSRDRSPAMGNQMKKNTEKHRVGNWEYVGHSEV